MSQEQERNFWLSRDFLDTLNSLSWFFMDATWMLGYTRLSEIMIPITILSAIFLIYIEKRPSLFFINIGIMFWILMNVTWMLFENRPDLLPTQTKNIFFLLGLSSIFLAILTSKNIKETFSHFKRFRMKRRF